MAQVITFSELPLSFGYAFLAAKSYTGECTLTRGHSVRSAIAAALLVSASIGAVTAPTESRKKLNVKVDDYETYDGEPNNINRPATMPWQFPDSTRIGPVVFLCLLLSLLGMDVTGSPHFQSAIFSVSVAMTFCHFFRFVGLFSTAAVARKVAAFNELFQAGILATCLIPMALSATTGRGMVAAQSPTRSHGSFSWFSGSPSHGAFSWFSGPPSWAPRAVFQSSLFLFIWLPAMSLAKGLERLSNWLRPYMIVFFLNFHLFALAGLWRLWHHVPVAAYIPSRRRLLGECFVLYLVGGLGITAGAHRMWSHRAYKANLPYRMMMLMFQSLAAQGTVYDWSRDHRAHHKYSEKEADPHNAMKGFFYSHIGWLLTKRPRAVVEGRRSVDVSDLLEDSCVRAQLWLDPYFNLVVCFLLPSLYSMYRYDDFWLGFFTIGCLRWVWTLHCTWCVNSVAHTFGPRPYNEESGARESWLTSLMTVGEGWHSWHHQYAFDYAASELGALRQYNPTKIWIDVFALLGWTWDRKRATKLWEQAKQDGKRGLPMHSEEDPTN